MANYAPPLLCYNSLRNCGSKEPLFYLEKLSWQPEK
nr:MAG TPA: hypothetical protein [Caudoviricetes sp.]